MPVFVLTRVLLAVLTVLSLVLKTPKQLGAELLWKIFYAFKSQADISAVVGYMCRTKQVIP